MPSMIRVTRAFMLLILPFAILLNEPATASTGAIQVVVRNAKTREPIRATIVLSGPVATSDVSNEKGTLRFEDIPDGTYAMRGVAAGYKVAISKAFSVSGADVEIDIDLVPISELKTISSVTVHAWSATSQMIGRNDVLRRLGSNPISGLSGVAGVSLDDERGPSSSTTLSLEGHDPSQTRVTLDGVPLNVPGMAMNINAIDSYLFSGSAITFGSPSGAAGTVAFRTVDPTRIWQGEVDSRFGGYGSHMLDLTQTGSLGRVGFAFQHDRRLERGALDGLHYLDASGLDYAHSNASVITGDVAKVRYNAGLHNVSVTNIWSTRQSDIACDIFVNVLPCGYGPGNFSRNTFALHGLSDAFTIGSTSVLASFYSTHNTSSVDLSHRTIYGVPVPAVQSSNTDLFGSSLYFDFAAGRRHAFSLQTSSNYINAQAANRIAGASSTASQSYAYDTATLADRIHAGPKQTATLSFTAADTTISGGSLIGAVGFEDRLNANTVATYSITAGTVVEQQPPFTGMSDPSSLFYDCAAGIAIGSGPTPGSNRRSVQLIRAGWMHYLPAGNVALSLYAEHDRPSNLNVLVSAGALAPGIFSAPYVSQLAWWSEKTGCGQQYGIKNLYLGSKLSDSDVYFQGASLHGRLLRGQRLSIFPQLAIQRVVAISHAAVLKNGFSFFQSGAQVRGVPILSGSVAGSFRISAETELIGDIKYAGWNNRAGLPPNAIVDLGMAKKIARGVALVNVMNVLNSHPGRFTTASYALPFVASNGLETPAFQNPSTPRQIFGSYSIGIGKDLTTSDTVDRAIADKTTSASLVPGYLIEHWPLTAPLNSFKRNPGYACTAEYAKIADRTLSPIRDLIGQIESHKAGNIYPDEAPVKLPEIPGFELKYYSSGSTYSLALTTPRISYAQSVVACEDIHVGTPDNGHAAGVFVPNAPSVLAASVYFSPRVGFYVIQLPPQQGVAQKFRTYGVPKHSPENPFAISNGDICRSDLRPIASRLLSELRNYFSQSQPPSGDTPNWRIVRHGSETPKVWYELKSDDIGSIYAVLNCGFVAAARADQLKSLGVGGVSGNTFNFSPSIGLYLAVPSKDKETSH